MKTLFKEHSLVGFQTGTGTPGQEAWFEGFFGTTQGEFIKVGNPNIFTIATEQYIDLAGLSQQDKSVFFERISTQDALNVSIQPKVTGGTVPSGAQVILYDIMTSVPLDIDTINDEVLYGIGFKESQYDFEHVIYCRTNTYATDLDFDGALTRLTSSLQTGSGEPTASDRLYIYRVVAWTERVADARVFVYPGRMVMDVDVVEEPMLTHIYRLKRSYDLQQSFDRD